MLLKSSETWKKYWGLAFVYTVHQMVVKQEAQLWLTNRPTLVLADVKISLTQRYEAQLCMRCCQELPSGEWLRFSVRIFYFYLPRSHLTPSWRGIPSSYRVHIWYGKTRMSGLQSVEVAWWLTLSFGHNTSQWQTHIQPRRHSKCRANALRRAQNNWESN